VDDTGLARRMFRSPTLIDATGPSLDTSREWEARSLSTDAGPTGEVSAPASSADTASAVIGNAAKQAQSATTMTRRARVVHRTRETSTLM
jgi:hypothetical protein